MAQRKTQETDASVKDFLDSIAEPEKREDAHALVKIFTAATGQKPTMWGSHIVGFGKRHYTYANGKPAELCKVGFAPRARSFALYLARFPGSEYLYGNLGKHKFCGGCLHITRLSQVNPNVLQTIIKRSFSASNSSANHRDT